MGGKTREGVGSKVSRAWSMWQRSRVRGLGNNWGCAGSPQGRGAVCSGGRVWRARSVIPDWGFLLILCRKIPVWRIFIANRLRFCSMQIMIKYESLLLSWMSRLAAVTVSIACAGFAALAADNAREPQAVVPGTAGGAPSDAVVLFDGKDLSKWRGEKGGAARWVVADGCAMVNGTGSIFTKEEFGDVQLHLEWASPEKVEGEGQGRGNSGVYFQGRYEIQVLDCYNNKTYFDGMTGAFYSNFAPLVNACRKPGEWQTYDIVFHAPKAGVDGKSVEPGSFTVFLNGILVQGHVPVKGSTTSAAFTGAVVKGPLMLQDHGNPVRYRNIWLRPLN